MMEYFFKGWKTNLIHIPCSCRIPAWCRLQWSPCLTPAAGCGAAFSSLQGWSSTAPSSGADRGDHPHGKKSYTHLKFPLPPVLLLCVSHKVLALSLLSKALRGAFLAAFTSFSSSISHLQPPVCLDNISICSLDLLPLPIDFVLHLRNSLSALLALCHSYLTFCS